VKLIHFADLHIGVDAYAKAEAQTGLDTRLRDLLSALDRLCDYAAENQVDAVLFAGDAYKNRDPSQTQQRELAIRLIRLAKSGIAVVLVSGNHDMPYSRGRATSQDIFALTHPNIHVFSTPQCVSLPTRSGELVVCALPWLRRGNIAENALKKWGLPNTIGQTNQDVTKITEHVVSKLAEEATAKDPHQPTVLVAHLWAQEAKLGSEHSYCIAGEPIIPISLLANPTFHYVALGHIHKMQILRSDAPAIVYSGSLERLDFGEEKDEKGFMVIDIESSKPINYHFVTLNGRRFFTLDIEVPTDSADPMAHILNQIDMHRPSISDAIVRLIIKLNTVQADLLKDQTFIRQALNSAHNFVVVKQVTRPLTLRLPGQKAEEITPIQALGQYLRLQNDLSPQTKKQLLNLGQELINNTDSKFC